MLTPPSDGYAKSGDNKDYLCSVVMLDEDGRGTQRANLLRELNDTLGGALHHHSDLQMRCHDHRRRSCGESDVKREYADYLTLLRGVAMARTIC